MLSPRAEAGKAVVVAPGDHQVRPAIVADGLVVQDGEDLVAGGVEAPDESRRGEDHGHADVVPLRRRRRRHARRQRDGHDEGVPGRVRAEAEDRVPDGGGGRVDLDGGAHREHLALVPVRGRQESR